MGLQAVVALLGRLRAQGLQSLCKSRNARINLSVPYANKEARALGARWDPGQRTWYAAAGVDLSHFDRCWLSADSRLPDAEDSAPEITRLATRNRGLRSLRNSWRGPRA